MISTQGGIPPYFIMALPVGVGMSFIGSTFAVTYSRRTKDASSYDILEAAAFGGTVGFIAGYYYPVTILVGVSSGLGIGTSSLLNRIL